jgi:biopolymer transport protein ExbD
VISAPREDGDGEIISEINVTPFVDISLVLLIIFMVTATYIVSRSIPVDLPKASSGEDVSSTVAITITKDDAIFYEGEKLADVHELRARIEKARSAQKELRAVIAADRDIRHGRFVSVVNAIREAGIVRFAINVKEEDIVE